MTNTKKTTRWYRSLPVALPAAAAAVLAAAPSGPARAACHAVAPPQPVQVQVQPQVAPAPRPQGTPVTIGGAPPILPQGGSTGGATISISGPDYITNGGGGPNVYDVLLEQMKQKEAAAQRLHEQWLQQRAQQGRAR